MTPLRIAAVLLAVLVLAGCATTDERSSRSAAPDRGADAVVTDDEYVAAVEAVARTRHMGVHWVNVPTKRVKRDD